MLEGEARFYEPEYIPEGMKLINTDVFFDQTFDRVYEDKEGNYLYIDQCKAEYVKLRISTTRSVRGKIKRLME